MDYYGGIETGGTKCVCIVAKSPTEVIAETQFATESPGVTVNKIARFFEPFISSKGHKIKGIGLASFGPVDLHPESPHYGFITSTPKPGWGNFNLLGEIKKNTQIPMFFDTDTNGAALGEWLWGAARGLDQFLYLTIGTGIGGGAIIHSEPVHGLVHPEMGHILLPHDTKIDPFPGICPFHYSCFEGLASGPAIEKRWGCSAKDLPENHPAWDLEAHYIALGLQSLICSYSPQRIILGGGVMKRGFLFPLIRDKVLSYLAGYVKAQEITDEIDQYIVAPALGDRAGVLGAVALAKIKMENLKPNRLE